MDTNNLGRCPDTHYGTEGWVIAQTEISEKFFLCNGLEDLMSMIFEPHVKYPSCIIGNSTPGDFLKLKCRALNPLGHVNWDSFSSWLHLLNIAIMQLFLLIVTLETDGSMVCK